MKILTRDDVLGISVLIVIGGSLLLAFLDDSSRPFFADLTRLCVGVYLGRSLPRAKVN